MAKREQAPATKADIKIIMDEIGRLYDANERWKNELKVEMDRRASDSEKRMKNHFDLAVENIRADLTGANKDRIEGHEHRIVQLEKHIGIAV